MADRVITAEALITARDGTGDVFAKIGAKYEKGIGNAAKSSKQVGELCDKLDAAAKRLRELEKLQSNMAGFAKARAAFNENKAALEAHARAMKATEAPTKKMAADYERLQGVVSRSAAAFEKAKTAAMGSKRALEAFGAPVSKIAAEQERLRGVIERTTHAIEHQTNADNAAARASHKNAAARGHAEHGFGAGVRHGMGHLSGVSSLVSGYGVVYAAERGLETYREFDKERRYGKAVMGITDEQQAPLIHQAIEGGATSRYNDIQWLEAQRELAARGLKREQILALTGVSATIGQAMDKTLPEASKALEGGMFGFGKDTSTYEKALAAARRTADLQVKASKISGMDYEDIVAAYKYGAAPFRMAGLTEEQLLAFAAVGKKANMGGDEMGVAARALAANLLKPTAGARTAMLANGVDYSKFQVQGGKPMDVDAFTKSIAAVYGVNLNDKARSGLKGIFDNKALVADASKYMPAVMKVLEDGLGKQDAKSKKSIAGEARRYRDASMSGVDAQALFSALMPAIAKNPALANLVFGSKQGARIRAAIGDPDTFLHKLDELVNHSQGYAQNVSDARMTGYDGAMYRLTGAIANLQTAFGRAFDHGGQGNGGILTAGTKMIAGGIQAFVDAPAALQRLTFEAGAAATAFAAFKGLQGLTGGFGLSASAGELTHAAVALEGAATRLGAGGAIGAAEGAAADLAGGTSKKLTSRLVRIGKTVPLVGTAIIAATEGLDFLQQYKKDHPEKFHAHAQAAYQPGYGGHHILFDPNGWEPDQSKQAMGPFRKWSDPLPSGRGRPAVPGHWSLDSAPHFPSLGGNGAITATVQQPIPVDVTGKVQLQGQANVSVSVKVDGGSVTNQSSSSSGNIKISTGSSMPGAKTASAGTATK